MPLSEESAKLPDFSQTAQKSPESQCFGVLFIGLITTFTV
jgi:hypothetical protein